MNAAFNKESALVNEIELNIYVLFNPPEIVNAKHEGTITQAAQRPQFKVK